MISAGMIDASLFPDTDRAQRLRVVQGEVVKFDVAIKNVGGVAIAPWYWLRVLVLDPIGGVVGREREWEGQMASIPAGGTVHLLAEDADFSPVNWRGVYLTLYSSSGRTGILDEAGWDLAYEVTPSTISAEILGLELGVA